MNRKYFSKFALKKILISQYNFLIMQLTKKMIQIRNLTSYRNNKQLIIHFQSV